MPINILYIYRGLVYYYTSKTTTSQDKRLEMEASNER